MSELYKSLVRIKLNNIDSKDSINNEYSIYEKINPKFTKVNEITELIKKSNKISLFDLYIQELCKANKNDIDLILILRCRISHAIRKRIKSIWSGANKNSLKISLKDLASEVLEDNGERYLFFVETKKKNNLSNNSGYRKSYRKPFNLNTIEELYKYSTIKKERDKKYLDMFDRGRIHPFSANIINSYNAKNGASISTWATYLVDRDKGIKRITRPRGQRTITDWALINGHSLSQIKRAWKKYGDNDLETIDKSIYNFNKLKREKIILQIIEQIYNLYTFNYVKEKDNYRAKNKRDIGWEPDLKFFNKLKPRKNPENIELSHISIREILRKIALAIRTESGQNIKISSFEDYKTYSSESKKIDSEEFISIKEYRYEDRESLNIAEQNSKQLEDLYKSLIINQAFKQTKKVIKNDMKNWDKNKPFLKNAWILFAQKREFSEICQITDIGKPSLSKKFKFEIIASNTANYVVMKLKEIIYCEEENISEFIKEFNKNNYLNTELDFEIIKVLKRSLTLSTKSNKTVFDDPEKFEEIINSIRRFVNPRKGIKNILTEIVKDIIEKEK